MNTYTISQVAKMLGVHEDTVRRWIHSGELPATRHGITGRYKVDESDLVKFVEKREQEHAA